MKDIFANLYNKVVSFFHQADNKDAENAKNVACSRLKLVLMQDRTNLSPAIMDRMKRELIELLSKYVELDKELLDLNLEHENDQMALMLSIPVIRAKNEDEIQEILDKEDAEKKAQEDLDDEDTEDAEDAEEENLDEDDDSSEDEDTADEENDEDSEDDETEETEGEDDSEENSEDEPEEEIVEEKKSSKK
jgi:cell division topological specificity factor MinE